MSHSLALAGIEFTEATWLCLDSRCEPQCLAHSYPCNGFNVAGSSYGSQIFSVGFISIEKIDRVTELWRPSMNCYTVRVAIPSL